MAIVQLALLLTLSIFLPGSESTSTKITYYNLVVEKDYKLGSDAVLATCDGKKLTTVSKQFADKIALEGSGVLRDDKTYLNLGSCIKNGRRCKPNNKKYSCFEKGTAAYGSNDNVLVPYVSVATTNEGEFKYGATGVIKDFVGKKTPQGETHDGCVRIDDNCSTCEEKAHIDFYAYSHKNVEFFEKNWKDSDQRVEFVANGCTPRRYKY